VTHNETPDLGSPLRVTRSQSDYATVIAPVGEIDISTIGLLNVEIAAATGTPERPLVVDLNGVSFMDSTGLRTLVEAANGAAQRAQAFAVFRVPPAVKRVLQITKLEAHFHEVADLEPATLTAIRSSASA
jgi:anti-sigma B factor antagonist